MSVNYLIKMFFFIIKTKNSVNLIQKLITSIFVI